MAVHTLRVLFFARAMCRDFECMISKFEIHTEIHTRKRQNCDDNGTNGKSGANVSVAGTKAMIRAYLVVSPKTHLLNFLYCMSLSLSLSVCVCVFRCFSFGADARAKRKMNYPYELHSMIVSFRVRFRTC